MKLMHWIFAVCLFTASCDIFLVVNVGGTLRLEQVLMVLVSLGALAMVIQTGTVLWPRGGTALLLWCCLQALYLPVSSARLGGVSFYLLLMFTISGVYGVLQLYGRSSYLPALMKVYINSYVVVAAFGIFQLITPPLHLGTYLVTQWIVYQKFPRINGFSYEPSFYATYILMGWIMLLDLRASRARIVEKRRWKWITVMVGCSLFLSTSKTAWIFIALEGVSRVAPIAWRVGDRALRQILTGDLRIRLPHWKRVVAGVGLIGVLVVAFSMASSAFDLKIFLSGSGINNTSAHSVIERMANLTDTLQVLKEQPLLGRGMAGTAARIAEHHGRVVESIADMKLNWGFPVILDVLASSGVFGIIPFLWFFAVNTLGQIGLIRREWPDERAKWLRALTRALIFECLILMVDQNLVRAYFWFHITMVVIVEFNLRERRESVAYRARKVAYAA